MDPTLVKNEKKGEKRFIIRGDRESVTTQEEKRARSIIARRTERINDKATHTEKSRLSCFPFGHHFGVIHDVSIYFFYFFPPPFFFLFFFIFIFIYIYKFSLSPLISHGQLLYYYYPLSLSAERQRRETREMAKARISRIYTWSAEQLWSEFYVSVDLTNGQLTPNNNTPLLTQALSGTSKSLPFLFGFRSFMYRFINLSLHR